MIFHVLTLFPEMISQAAGHSILGRAQAAGHISVRPVNIRDYAVNAYGQVDDAPYGGGAGMVMMAQPIYDAVKSVGRDCPVVYLSPGGEVLTQARAREMAAEYDEIILICGHYEGIDRRVTDEVVTHEISIGNYVLTGGEPAALVLIDTISRLRPGVLGNADSARYESFSPELGGGIEHPHYTRPAVWRGREVPPVLLSGNHAEIEKWRRGSNA